MKNTLMALVVVVMFGSQILSAAQIAGSDFEAQVGQGVQTVVRAAKAKTLTSKTVAAGQESPLQFVQGLMAHGVAVRLPSPTLEQIGSLETLVAALKNQDIGKKIDQGTPVSTLGSGIYRSETSEATALFIIEKDNSKKSEVAYMFMAPKDSSGSILLGYSDNRSFANNGAATMMILDRRGGNVVSSGQSTAPVRKACLDLLNYWVMKSESFASK